MTTTTLNLDALELVDLGVIGLAILAYTAKQVIDHWDEIEQGFQDNFNPR